MMKDFKTAFRRIWRKLFSVSRYPRSSFGAIGKGTVIGDQCVIVPRYMFLDDYVAIQNHVHFISAGGKLVVKKFSVISAQCVIVPGTHMPVPGIPFYFQTTTHAGDEQSTITIEEDCWIASGCTLLMKSHIGRGAIVAAGSVVTKTVPPYAVVAGSPAKVIAVKFSKEDILRHEEALYEPSERLTPGQIDALFAEHYRDVKVLRHKDPADVPGHYDRASGRFIEMLKS